MITRLNGASPSSVKPRRNILTTTSSKPKLKQPHLKSHAVDAKSIQAIASGLPPLKSRLDQTSPARFNNNDSRGK